MSVTPAPQDEFHQPQWRRQAVPVLASVLVLAAVAFTSWFWLTQDEDLITLVPLYLAAGFFCVDMVFLRKSRRDKSKDIY